MLNPIDEIKNRLNIVEVISSYIKLQKAGANFRALCPFHSEKKPSLFVSPVRQIWHCFGCGKGGDIFGFVREIEGVEFGDALRLLAQKAGIQLKKQDPKIRSERQRLYEICELATRFFEKQLEEGSTGQEAKKYLLGRGLKEESIKKWRIGYSPDVWQGLSDFLSSRGYQREEIQRAGLALTSEKGSFYDRFRGRIIFPIFDLNSQVVGFGGRVFNPPPDPGGGLAKYVNTPNTLLYDKSRILYGLDKAKVEIRKKDACILVEGYIDAMMVSQSGFGNVAATSGTALTSYQLQVLKRYSGNLLTAFDMDVAGDSATKRGIDLVQHQGFNIKIITMPQAKDPAELIFQNPQDWERVLGEAKSILEFYFDTTFSRFNAQSPDGKREISKILLPVIKRIPNQIEKSHWVQALAKKIEIKEEVVEEELKNTKIGSPDYAPAPVFQAMPAVAKTRKDILGERIVSLILRNPQNLGLIGEDFFPYFSLPLQAILTDLQQQKSPQESDFLNYLFLKSEIEKEEIDDVAEIKTCLREIKNLDIRGQLDELSCHIKKAEDNKDFGKVQELIQRFKELAGQLINL